MARKKERRETSIDETVTRRDSGARKCRTTGSQDDKRRPAAKKKGEGRHQVAEPKGRRLTPPSRTKGRRAAGTTSLVIVESPAKAKTIGKYLGRGYRVKATVGHVRDLPEKKLGIDIENGFEPEYVTISGKGEDARGAQERGEGLREDLPRDRP